MAFEFAEYQPSLEVWMPSTVAGSPKKRMLENGGYEPQFPCEFPYEWGSPAFQLDLSLCPQVGASVGLSETDEEEDHMAGLAERIAYSMLDDDDDDDKLDVPPFQWLPGHDNPKRVMARSPQSTLRSPGCWPTVSLKPVSPALAGADDWELFNVASSQGVRLGVKSVDEPIEDLPEASHGKIRAQGHMGGPCGMRNLACSRPQVQWRQNAAPVLSKDAHHMVSRFSGADLSCNAVNVLHRTFGSRIRAEDGKNQAHQCQESRHCPGSSVGRQARAAQAQPVRGSRSCGAKKAANRSNQPCYPGQAGGGPGMRAVFLGANGSGRESGGTGVFLPRRMNSGSHPKKPACSTVLLPARIVQALNLNVEDLRPLPFVEPDPSTRHIGYDSIVDGHQDVWCEEQGVPFSPVLSRFEQPSEISLPNEWTY